MAISTKCSDLSHTIITQISKELNIEVVNKGISKGPFNKKSIIAYTLTENDNLYLPFSYAITSLGFTRPTRETYEPSTLKFTSELREAQVEVKDEALALLNKNGHVMIASYTGFGKSILGVYLSSKTKLKTLVLIPNKTVLIPQWKESYEKFCSNVKVQILTSKDDTLDNEANVYIMNALNAGKKSPSFFKSIGTLIVDESHLIVADMLIKSMHNIFPRYLIGLSATPYRNDGLDVLIKIHFGDQIIQRKMCREHYAYLIKTGFTPPTEIGVGGKINWSALISAQSENDNRNRLIASIAMHFNTRVFLILVKRVSQAKSIGDMLIKHGENVVVLTGNSKEFDKSARIVIGTQQKCGIGFDHIDLDAMILGNDIEDYFIQSLGRIFRRQNTVPIVFDLVDNNPILDRHWKTRKAVYKEHGGTVKDFSKEFPDFTVNI